MNSNVHRMLIAKKDTVKRTSTHYGQWIRPKYYHNSQLKIRKEYYIVLRYVMYYFNAITDKLNIELLLGEYIQAHFHIKVEYIVLSILVESTLHWKCDFFWTDYDPALSLSLSRFVVFYFSPLAPLPPPLLLFARDNVTLSRRLKLYNSSYLPWSYRIPLHPVFCARTWPDKEFYIA